MSFFYHTEAGAWYFACLALAFVLSIFAGGKKDVSAGLVIVGVFLSHRFFLASFGPTVEAVSLGAFTDLIGLFLSLRWLRGLFGAWFALMFFAKLASYAAFALTLTEWGVVPIVTELAGYLQILVLGGGSFGTAVRTTGTPYRSPDPASRFFGPRLFVDRVRRAAVARRQDSASP